MKLFMNNITKKAGKSYGLFVLLLALLLVSCGTENTPEEMPTEPATAVAAQPVATEVFATWTAVPAIVEEKEVEPTEPPPPTNTPLPTSTAVPATDTPEPTATATDTPEPTETAVPPTTAPPVATQPPVPPTLPPEPVLGVNLLPNPSFEEGHYNQDGVPELQLPVGWRLEWSTSPTGLGSESWDVFVRPEARVLSTAFLPPSEHPLYIYDGNNTVKIFKGSGAVDFKLLTDVTLEPGTYVIEAKMFADTVQGWSDGQKVWAGAPDSAQVRFLVGDGGTNWQSQRFGQINVHNWTFSIDEPKTITVGIGLRGIYAIANNGWFIDDLSLRRVE